MVSIELTDRRRVRRAASNNFAAVISGIDLCSSTKAAQGNAINIRQNTTEICVHPKDKNNGCGNRGRAELPYIVQAHNKASPALSQTIRKAIVFPKLATD